MGINYKPTAKKKPAKKAAKPVTKKINKKPVKRPPPKKTSDDGVQLNELLDSYNGRELTIKQASWIHWVLNGMSPTDAAQKVYQTKNRLTAKVMACELKKKLGITMSQMLEISGLDLEEDIADLKRLRKAKKLHGENLIEVDDNAIQLKALDLTLKLKGETVEKVDMNVKGEVGVQHKIFFQKALERARTLRDMREGTGDENEAED